MAAGGQAARYPDSGTGHGVATASLKQFFVGLLNVTVTAFHCSINNISLLRH